MENKKTNRNLGVDIDGVITNIQDYVFEYGAKFAYERGYNLKEIRKTLYATPSIFNWSEDVDDEFWFAILEQYSREERPRIFASEVLHKLKEDGWNIFLITARASMKEEDKKNRLIETILENWLKEHDIPYDVLDFAGSDKREALKEHDIDIMIEDSPKNIEQLRPICPIIVFDAMYNKECVGEGILRVNSWYEILYFLRDITDEDLY